MVCNDKQLRALLDSQGLLEFCNCDQSWASALLQFELQVNERPIVYGIATERNNRSLMTSQATFVLSLGLFNNLFPTYKNRETHRTSYRAVRASRRASRLFNHRRAFLHTKVYQPCKQLIAHAQLGNNSWNSADLKSGSTETGVLPHCGLQV